MKDVFGIAGYHTWPFPIDPVFDDHDKVMGFSTPQRLAREQQLMERRPPVRLSNELKATPDVDLPSCVNNFLPA